MTAQLDLQEHHPAAAAVVVVAATVAVGMAVEVELSSQQSLASRAAGELVEA